MCGCPHEPDRAAPASPIRFPHGQKRREPAGVAVSAHRPIVLIGFMGAGKSTVGRQLARRLGMPFFDSDAVIEQAVGRRVRDIFAEDGEQQFREIEHRTVTQLLRGERAVVALGGGAVEDARTQTLLAEAEVVYLHVDYAVALERVRSDGDRPMLQRSDLDEVYAARIPTYERVATVTIETDGRRADLVLAEVLAALPKPPIGR
jgi:shikimate kinase